MSEIILTVAGAAVLGVIFLVAISFGLAVVRLALWGITITGILGIIITVASDIDSPYTMTLWAMAIGGILIIALTSWLGRGAAHG